MKKPKSKSTAIVLAIFFCFWTWCYTWDKDYGKFLICLIVSIVLTMSIAGWIVLVPVSFGFWLWALIDTAIRPEEWYKNYKV